MKKERRNPFGGWCNGNKVRSTQWLTHRQKFSPHQGQSKLWTIFRDLAHWILIFRWFLDSMISMSSFQLLRSWTRLAVSPWTTQWHFLIRIPRHPTRRWLWLAVNSANVEKTERGKREWLVYPVTPTTPIIYKYIYIWYSSEYINDKHLNKWIIYIIYIHT